jgi:hypothetical protein
MDTTQETSNTGAISTAEQKPQPKTETPKVEAQPKSVAMEDFRKLQSELDKKIAAEKAQREAAEAKANELEVQVQNMQKQFADALPEDRRQAYLQAQEANELQRLRAEVNRGKAARQLSAQFGIPEGILLETANPTEMFTKALSWFKEQQNAPKEDTMKKEEKPKVEEAEAATEEASTVSKSAPKAVTGSGEENADWFEKIKKQAAQGGKNREAARLAFLSAQTGQVKTTKPKV